MIRLIIADDHNLLRESLQYLLMNEPSVKVVADAPNGKMLLDYLETTPADVIILDIHMPVMNGIEATRIITEQYPDVKILVLTMLDSNTYLQLMLDAGATGYILKSTEKKELLLAIHEVAAGRQYITKVLSDKPQETISLSKREIEILEMLVEGLTNKEVAEKLFLSKRTVEAHRKNILEKTNCKNSSSLIKYAIYNGIIKNLKV